MDEMQENRDTLISRIYETAIYPGAWAELLENLVAWTPIGDLPGNDQPPMALDSLLGHLDRAVRSSDYMFSLEDQKQRLEDITNRLPWPMLMLDNSRQVISCNSAAQQHLGPDTGVSMDNGFLNVADPILRQELLETMRLGLGRGSQLLHSNREKLALLCMPVQHSDALDHSARITTVIWVFAGQNRGIPSPQALESLFKLTPAESRLLHALCKLGDLQQCAELLSVRTNTVRTQLKSIMRKTGVHSQAALVSETMNHALLSSSIETPTPAEEALSLPDGRILSWYAYGAPNGRPLLVLENQGGLLPNHEPHHQWYAERGWRVIVVVRPGMGISTAHPGAGFADFANDLQELCKQLSLQRPRLAAFCVGGAFALSAAACHPGAYEKVGVIGSVVPPAYMDVQSLDPMNRMLWHLAKKDPRLFGYLGRLALRGINRAPEKYLKHFAKYVCEKDARFITNPALVEPMVKQLRQRWFQGTQVMLDEMLLLQRPWGVDLGNIRAPTQVWHGRDDRTISLASARRTAAAIPGVDFRELPDQGRYPIFECWRDFLDSVMT